MSLCRRPFLIALLLPVAGSLLPVAALARQGRGGGGDDRGGDDDRDDHDDDRDDDRDSDDDGGGNRDRTTGGSATDEPARRDRLPRLAAGQYRITREGQIETLSQDQFSRLKRSDPATSGWSQLVQIERGRVSVTDSAGWREEFGTDRYRLFDPRGNLVTRRPLTRADTARLRNMLP